MPLKKPFTHPLSFQSFQAKIDFLIQPSSPPSHSNQGSFLQLDYMEVLSLGSVWVFLFFFIAMSIKK